MRTPIIPVVMCTWHRPDNLQDTIQTLQNQVGVTVRLYIWNNNPEIASEVDAAITAANLTVEAIHSDTNVGGFGRFYYARQLADKYKYIVFIDDDQTLHENALSTLWSEAEPKKMSGWWAYNFFTPWSYWLRIRAKKGGSAAYIGTCGMITDSSIFQDERLFECPKDYWFIEDLWLSYFAQHIYHWRLQRSQACFRFIPDARNQVSGLVSKKSQFLRYLKLQGWVFHTELPM